MGANKSSAEQFKKFLETSRALDCDEDKEKFETQLGKIAEHKPSPQNKEPTDNKEQHKCEKKSST